MRFWPAEALAGVAAVEAKASDAEAVKGVAALLAVVPAATVVNCSENSFISVLVALQDHPVLEK